MTNDDLTWLTSERPSPRPLDPAATERARTALLERTRPRDADVHVLHHHRARHEPPRRRSVRALAMAGAAVVALVVALVVTSGGSRPERAEASPLTTLAHRVAQSPAPSGDATLVVRTQAGPGAPASTGYDLSLDDGRYFYGATPDELAQAITSGGEQDGWLKRVTSAAADVVDAPIDEARAHMADANLDPDAAPPSDEGAAAAAAAATAKAKDAGQRGQAEPMDPKTHLEGMIWTNSLSALILASGRPDVRAGVLRLLATCEHVTVEHGTRDGERTLVLTASHFPDGYQEQLTIDAGTGIPLRFTGGTKGQAPEVVITYESSRVTAADLAHP